MRKGGREGGDVEHQKVQKSEVVKHRSEREGSLPVMASLDFLTVQASL